MVVTIFKHIQHCFEPHIRSFTCFIQRLRPIGTGGRTDQTWAAPKIWVGQLSEKYLRQVWKSLKKALKHVFCQNFAEAPSLARVWVGYFGFWESAPDLPTPMYGTDVGRTDDFASKNSYLFRQRFLRFSLQKLLWHNISCVFRIFRYKKHIFDTILHRFEKHLHSFDKHFHLFDKHLHSFDMHLHSSDKYILQNSWKFSVILFNLTKNLLKLYIATKCNVFLFAENSQLSLLLYYQMFLYLYKNY